MAANSLKEFISELNLPFQGSFKGLIYVIDLNSSNDFSKVFDIVDLNDSLELEGSSRATEDESKFSYTDGYYEVRLEADYKTDIYTVYIEEK